jgi:hypothetical protein
MTYFNNIKYYCLNYIKNVKMKKLYPIYKNNLILILTKIYKYKININILLMNILI